jgi:hypothetical protein
MTLTHFKSFYLYDYDKRWLTNTTYFISLLCEGSSVTVHVGKSLYKRCEAIMPRLPWRHEPWGVVVVVAGVSFRARSFCRPDASVPPSDAAARGDDPPPRQVEEILPRLLPCFGGGVGWRGAGTLLVLFHLLQMCVCVSTSFLFFVIIFNLPLPPFLAMSHTLHN